MREPKKGGWREDVALRFTKQDIDRSRICAALAYIAFFVPVIIFPNEKFGRFHANQALLLTVLSTVGVTVLMFIPRVGTVLGFLLLALCVAFGVRGFILALVGKAKRVPLIGKLIWIEFEPRA